MDKLKKPGEKLENGYIVLFNNGRVVLAEKQFNENEGQFATWKFDVANGSTWAGHYFYYGAFDITKDAAHENAYADYLER